MTSEEERIVNIDKRQESFESFMRAYIDGNEKRLERFEARMDKLESKLDSLMIGGGIGLATILAGMVGMVVALITALKP